MRILIDTNVVLDIVQKREPFFADSYQCRMSDLCICRHRYFLYAPQGASVRRGGKEADRTAFPDRHLFGCTGGGYSYCTHAFYVGF